MSEQAMTEFVIIPERGFQFGPMVFEEGKTYLVRMDGEDPPKLTIYSVKSYSVVKMDDQKEGR